MLSARGMGDLRQPLPVVGGDADCFQVLPSSNDTSTVRLSRSAVFPPTVRTVTGTRCRFPASARLDSSTFGVNPTVIKGRASGSAVCPDRNVHAHEMRVLYAQALCSTSTVSRYPASSAGTENSPKPASGISPTTSPVPIEHGPGGVGGPVPGVSAAVAKRRDRDQNVVPGAGRFAPRAGQRRALCAPRSGWSPSLRPQWRPTTRSSTRPVRPSGGPRWRCHRPARSLCQRRQ